MMIKNKFYIIVCFKLPNISNFYKIGYNDSTIEDYVNY